MMKFTKSWDLHPYFFKEFPGCLDSMSRKRTSRKIPNISKVDISKIPDVPKEDNIICFWNSAAGEIFHNSIFAIQFSLWKCIGNGLARTYSNPHVPNVPMSRKRTKYVLFSVIHFKVRMSSFGTSNPKCPDQDKICPLKKPMISRKPWRRQRNLLNSGFRWISMNFSCCLVSPTP